MLKIIAVLIMTLDHATATFIDMYEMQTLYTIGRTIGRLAMPIFAYQIACGFIYTKNFDKYFTRIAVLTLVSQIPFCLHTYHLPLSDIQFVTNPSYFHTFYGHWSICLTFLFALAVLKVVTLPPTFFNNFVAFGVIFMVLNHAYMGNYGSSGILTVLVFYIYVKYKLNEFIIFAILLLIHSPYGVNMQTYCAFSIWLIRYIPNTRFKNDKWLFYAFYPAHLLILVLLANYF